MLKDNTVFILIRFSWDSHEPIGVFSSEEKARAAIPEDGNWYRLSECAIDGDIKNYEDIRLEE